ncbi:MAG: hypothetical protein R6X13_09670 [bacterium]
MKHAPRGDGARKAIALLLLVTAACPAAADTEVHRLSPFLDMPTRPSLRIELARGGLGTMYDFYRNRLDNYALSASLLDLEFRHDRFSVGAGLLEAHRGTGWWRDPEPPDPPIEDPLFLLISMMFDLMFGWIERLPDPHVRYTGTMFPVRVGVTVARWQPGRLASNLDLELRAEGAAGFRWHDELDPPYLRGSLLMRGDARFGSASLELGVLGCELEYRSESPRLRRTAVLFGRVNFGAGLFRIRL